MPRVLNLLYPHYTITRRKNLLGTNKSPLASLQPVLYGVEEKWFRAILDMNQPSVTDQARQLVEWERGAG